MAMTDYPHLFSPFTLNGLQLANRFVMAPMTRQMSPEQTPTADVVAYYKKRASGGVGLILTEGTTLRTHASTMAENVPKIVDGLTDVAWRDVIRAVHAEGGKIAIQLWHVGALRKPQDTQNPDIAPQSPSGLTRPGKERGQPLTDAQIQALIDDYVVAAKASVAAGFDGLEIHGAHGYLIDQFFWHGTNARTDKWGGDMVARTSFAQAVIAAVRAAVGADYPLILRISQWKQQDYEAKLADTPDRLEQFVRPLIDAGLDALHCSTRRFWEPEFEGSPLNFAGWVKKVGNLPTITVGSVGLETEFIATYITDDPSATADTHLADLEHRVATGEFDLVAVGRSLIANPNWVQLVRDGRMAETVGFARPMLGTLA